MSALIVCPDCGSVVAPRFTIHDCHKGKRWALQKRGRDGLTWRTIATMTESKSVAVERMLAHGKKFPGVYQLVPARRMK